MFKRFIVATDLSPASYAVVNCLSQLKTFGAEQCLLLQCLSFSDAISVGLSYHTDHVEAMLSEQKKILENQGFAVESRMVVGAPKREIVRISASEDYSLIVVGAQGHSLDEERMLGGVAYGIVNKSVKPVLVIPVVKEPKEENTCKPVDRSLFDVHVLFPTDFSQLAGNAFVYVQQMIVAGASKVTLVHVQEEQHMDSFEELQEHNLSRLENLKQSLLQQGSPQVDIKTCSGVPSQEILRIIQKIDVQLVVMGTQGHGFVGSLFLGSVSHNVARQSVAPVLLIPGLKKDVK